MKGLKSIIIVTALFMLIGILIAGCSNSEMSSDNAEMKEFTMEEIEKYDGKDGNPAYIVVDGVVYDVTDLPPWKGGMHNGYGAGRDLTEEIKTKSPHGVSKLKAAKVVGKVVE